MAWVMLVTLPCVALAYADRYADYTGVKMPHYGSGEYDTVRDHGHGPVLAEDYQGHSPDASSSFDYKYEDDRNGGSEKPLMDSEDMIKFNRHARKHRELFRPPDDNNLDTIENYTPKTESATKLRANRRFLKHRPRLKSKNSRNELEASSPRRSVKNIRTRKYYNDIHESDFNVDEDEIRDDGRELLDADYDRYNTRGITERVIRRKPRDKMFNKIRPNLETLTDSDTKEVDRNMKDERRINLDYMPPDEDHNGRKRPYKPISEEDDDLEPNKRKQKTGEDYGDFYDMKRIHNIKSKLPMLLRRPTARTDTTVADNTDEIEALWTQHRRMNAPVSITETTLLSSSTTSISTAIYTPTNTATTILTSKVLQKAPDQLLSFAEKSKLSILKKAQRKEGMVLDMSPKKPPVLLQVTNKMLTVVVVEPPTSEMPWMRASILVDDTPERLERAKRLMRNKLVARARNIQDLTDNWDEVVCDYIDMEMLDGVPQVNQCCETSAAPVSQASAAERQLQALLSPHRQRKDVSEPLIEPARSTARTPATFHRHAVEPALDSQWNDFIQVNACTVRCISTSLTTVALINYFTMI